MVCTGTVILNTLFVLMQVKHFIREGEWFCEMLPAKFSGQCSLDAFEYGKLVKFSSFTCRVGKKLWTVIVPVKG